MGYVDLDGTTEIAAGPRGRVPAWCWVALAVVWAGIAVACVDIQLRMNALGRDIARLEVRQRAEAERLSRAKPSPAYVGEAPRP